MAILTVAKNITKKAVDGLMDIINAGSVVNTDDFLAYVHLREDGLDHQVVNHNLG